MSTKSAIFVGKKLHVFCIWVIILEDFAINVQEGTISSLWLCIYAPLCLNISNNFLHLSFHRQILKYNFCKTPPITTFTNDNSFSKNNAQTGERTCIIRFWKHFFLFGDYDFCSANKRPNNMCSRLNRGIGSMSIRPIFKLGRTHTDIGYAPQFFFNRGQKWWCKLNRNVTSSIVLQNGTYI